MENKVLAKVGGKEITQNDVNELLKSVGNDKILQYASEEGQKQLLEELISQELLLQDAKNRNVDQQDDFKEEMERVKNTILKQFALREILTKVSVSDEFVKEYFDENQETFSKPATWKASHILVETEEEARKIAQEIKDGKSFGEAAMEYSKCPSKQSQGDLGFFASGQMVPEFESCVKELDINEISEAVATQFGYHLIQLTDKQEGFARSFDEIKDELTKQLILIHQEKAYIETAEKLKETISVEYL